MNADLYQQIANAIKLQVPQVLVTVVRVKGSSSANVGDKAIVNADGEMMGWVGGACCQRIIKKLAPEILLSNSPRQVRVAPKEDLVVDMECYQSHCASEGTVDMLLEPIANAASICVYGESPIASCVTAFCQELDIQVVQADPRYEEGASNSLGIAVVATQGTGDVPAVKHALATCPNGVLLVASAKKAASIEVALQKQGVDANAMKQLHSPAGIDIAAQNPAEIALSIVSQIVQLKNTDCCKPVANTALKAAPADRSKTVCCGGSE
ncbi:XdhC family protein [Porticoccus sp. GXU_MW_L64]